MNDSEINSTELEMLRQHQRGAMTTESIVKYFDTLRQRTQLQLNLGLGTTPKEIMNNLRRD